MSNVNDNNLDDLLRRAAEKYPLRTDSANFGKLVADLEEDPSLILPPLNTEDRRRRRRFFWLFLLLPLAGGAYYAWHTASGRTHQGVVAQGQQGPGESTTTDGKNGQQADGGKTNNDNGVAGEIKKNGKGDNGIAADTKAPGGSEKGTSVATPGGGEKGTIALTPVGGEKGTIAATPGGSEKGANATAPGEREKRTDVAVPGRTTKTTDAGSKAENSVARNTRKKEGTNSVTPGGSEKGANATALGEREKRTDVAVPGRTTKTTDAESKAENSVARGTRKKEGTNLAIPAGSEKGANATAPGESEKRTDVAVPVGTTKTTDAGSKANNSVASDTRKKEGTNLAIPGGSEKGAVAADAPPRFVSARLSLASTKGAVDVNFPVRSSSPDGVKQSAAAKEKTRLQKPKHSFYVGILGSPDLSVVKFQSVKGTGVNYGLLLGYSFNNHWAVETGIYHDRKKYYTDGEYFDKTKVQWMNYIDQLKVDGACTMWEIPINVRYNFSSGAKMNWFATAGLSTYLMYRESYDCSGYTNGTYYSRPWSHDVSYQNWFSIFNLSVGYEQQIGKIGKLRLEPFIRAPLSGLGTGKLSITSAGLNIGITRRIW